MTKMVINREAFVKGFELKIHTGVQRDGVDKPANTNYRILLEGGKLLGLQMPNPKKPLARPPHRLYKMWKSDKRAHVRLY
jgi:hypothetical protein